MVLFYFYHVCLFSLFLKFTLIRGGICGTFRAPSHSLCSVKFLIRNYIFNYSAVVVQILHQDMLITKHTSPLSFLFQATVTHLFEGVTCNCLECLFYINGFFGAGLKVGDVVLTLTPSLSPFGGYLCV